MIAPLGSYPKTSLSTVVLDQLPNATEPFLLASVKSPKAVADSACAVAWCPKDVAYFPFVSACLPIADEKSPLALAINPTAIEFVLYASAPVPKAVF